MLFLNLVAEEQSATRTTAQKTEVEETIIFRIAAGDRDALAELYNKTQKAVFAFALSILRNRQNAEDVLHDTYIKVWDNAATYRGQGKPMAWILAITRNLSLMRLKEHRNRDVLLDEQFYDVASENPVASRLDRLVLQQALTTLSEAERQIVILHALSGLKHREIATLMDLPISTVLSKYRRALKKLQSTIKEEN